MPFGMPATTRISRATALMPPVVPATITGQPGGHSDQAAAWASSSLMPRSAASSRPLSASQAGQAVVTMRRNSMVRLQCSA